jgi:hypothetical protein
LATLKKVLRIYARRVVTTVADLIAYELLTIEDKGQTMRFEIVAINIQPTIATFICCAVP